MCFPPQRRSLFQHLNCQKCSEAEVLSASRHSGVHFFDRNFQKRSECRVLMRVLCMWASKCASRHNGVRFFNFSTSKSASNPSVFNTFDFEICFAPQRRALFRHINLPKVVREWCALDILTSKCASRHNGVQLFMFYLATWLCMRRFSEPTFRPSRATNHWKNRVSRLFYLFSHLDLLSSETFSFFSDSSHLCFSSVHIVGSLTSKLPSAIITTTTITTTATTTTTHNHSYNFSCNYKCSYNYNYKETTQHHATSTSYG